MAGMVIAGGSPGIALVAGLVGGFGIGFTIAVLCGYAEHRSARRRAVAARRPAPRLTYRDGEPVPERHPLIGGRWT